MLRKAMWCGAVLAVLGAAGVYLTMNYARRHPDSVVGQCLVKSCQASRVCEPVTQVSEEAVERTYEAIREVMEHPDMVPTTVPVIPAEPAPSVADAPPCPEACPKAGTDDAPMLGKIVIQPDAEEPPAAKPPAGPAAGGTDEAEEPPPMPPARDDDPVPPKMPYATDRAPEAEQGIEFWWKLVQEAAAQGVDATEEEECLPPPAGTDCREDPNYDHHYSGCPHMGPCPQAGKCPGCGKADPVTKDKAAPHHTDAGTEEQTAPPAVPPVMPKSGPQAQATKHRTIDTTEYRPSDGNPFDFGSFPY